MESLEEMRNIAASVAADQIAPGLGWYYAEKYRKLVHRIAVEISHNFKSNEAAKFVRDLSIVILTPQGELDQKVITQVANKVGVITNELEENIDAYNRMIEKSQNAFKELKRLQTLVDSMGFLLMWNPATINNLHKAVDTCTHSKNEQNSALIKVAAKFQNVTAEEWKNIEAIFERKKLKFSSDFVRRCQETAKKSMAA